MNTQGAPASHARMLWWKQERNNQEMHPNLQNYALSRGGKCTHSRGQARVNGQSGLWNPGDPELWRRGPLLFTLPGFPLCRPSWTWNCQNSNSGLVAGRVQAVVAGVALTALVSCIFWMKILFCLLPSLNTVDYLTTWQLQMEKDKNSFHPGMQDGE